MLNWVVIAKGCSFLGRHTVTNVSWKFGVSGDFATASNWSPAAVPGPADDVTIGTKRTYTVTSSANETIDSLTITDKHATLLITGQSVFSTSSGVNDGTITVDSGSNLSISNFTFPPPGSFVNSGTLEAKNTNNLSIGGSLSFSQETITNTPQGVIEANGANTRVNLGATGNTTIVGGTLETQGANAVINMGGGGGDLTSGGTIGSGTTLDGTQPGNPVNIVGNVVGTFEAAIGLIGTINNHGVITIGGDFPWLVCEGNVTLDGGGDITMTDPFIPTLNFAPSIFGGVLTNVDNTISGTAVIGQMETSGGLGPHVGTFINEAKGTIDADASTPILITGIGPDTNAGLMEATQGGTLLIDGVTIDNFLHHAKGTVEAGQNSTVGLENATITGGLVKALSGSIIEAEQGSNIITGAHVKNAGTIGAESADLTIVGDVHNHKGDLDANNATLVIDGAVKGGTATLEGTGEIEFGGASSAHVKFAANAEATLKLDDPLTFKGTVSGFTAGNYIDLTDIDFANKPTLHYSLKKEVLTVTDNVTHVTDTIKFEGVIGSFSAQSDGSAGTLITVSSPTNMVSVSHCQDSFVFHSHPGENAAANFNAHNDVLDPPHSEFANLAALLTEAHHDAAVHDGTEIATLDHAMALAAHQAHGFLV
jgi:hypothetical protein